MVDPLDIRDELVDKLLDGVEEMSAQREPDQLGKKEYQQGFAHAISRERAARMIRAVLGHYGDRAGSFASYYGSRAVYEAWGIDWDKSKIEWLPKDKK